MTIDANLIEGVKIGFAIGFILGACSTVAVVKLGQYFNEQDKRRGKRCEK